MILPSIRKEHSKPGRMNTSASNCGLLLLQTRLKSLSQVVAFLSTSKYSKIKRKLIYTAMSMIPRSCQVNKILSANERLVLVALEAENCETAAKPYPDEEMPKPLKEKVLALRDMQSGDGRKLSKNMMASQNQLRLVPKL